MPGKRSNQSIAKPLKLNLGCGHSPIKGFINVDIKDMPGVDQVVDPNQFPGPWADNSVDEVRAEDSLEHLTPDPIAGQWNIVLLLNEIHRILKPAGLLVAKIPTTDGRGAGQDPTHKTWWNANTFFYFDPTMPQFTLYQPQPWQIVTLEHTLGQGDIIWMYLK